MSNSKKLSREDLIKKLNKKFPMLDARKCEDLNSIITQEGIWLKNSSYYLFDALNYMFEGDHEIQRFIERYGWEIDVQDNVLFAIEKRKPSFQEEMMNAYDYHYLNFLDH